VINIHYSHFWKLIINKDFSEHGAACVSLKKHQFLLWPSMHTTVVSIL